MLIADEASALQTGSIRGRRWFSCDEHALGRKESRKGSHAQSTQPHRLPCHGDFDRAASRSSRCLPVAGGGGSPGLQGEARFLRACLHLGLLGAQLACC